MASDVCFDANVTYAHRVDDPANYNWCIIPESAYDAVLFAGVALLVACVVSGRLSAVWVLVAGALCEVASYRSNLGRFGNSVALWLGGIHPGEVFFYTFLPPLLLDSAARVDFFIFKKVLVLSLMFAFVLVCTTTLLAVPLMLWGLGLGPRYGWGWADVALFNAMVASTDAVAVTSVLRAGGAPELLGALLEGESLFNDASGIVLFDIFLRKVLQARHKAAEADATHMRDVSLSSTSVAAHHHPHPSPSPTPPQPLPAPSPYPSWLPALPPWAAALIPELATVCREFAWLVVGGLAVGLACGVAMKWALRLLQWRRLKPHVEVSLTFASGYLAFYIANAYLQASGVIAVVVFGVYGAATGMWGLSSQARRAGAFDRFWDVLAFCINGLIFFLLGASAVNYLIRLGVELDMEGGKSRGLLLETLLMLPLMYVTLFAMRGLLIAAFCFAARTVNLRRLRKHAAVASKAAVDLSSDAAEKDTVTSHGPQGPGAQGNKRTTSTAHPTPQLHEEHQSAPHSKSQQAQHAAQEAAAALDATPDWRGMIFATVGGLRGAVSLIMAQIVLAAIGSQPEHTRFDAAPVVTRRSAEWTAFGGRESRSGAGWNSARRDKEVTAQMVVWTSGFVLMSLVVNAPLLAPLMTLLRLNTTSPIKQMVRARAKAALRRFTVNALNEMKAAAELADGTDGSGGLDMSLMLLRGVDWTAVERVVDLSRKLDSVFPGTPLANTTAAPTATQRSDHPTAGTASASKPSLFTRRNTSTVTVTSQKRRMGRSAASAGLVEPLLPRDQVTSHSHSHSHDHDHGYRESIRNSHDRNRSHSHSYRRSQEDDDKEQRGAERVPANNLETAIPSRPYAVVRFEDQAPVPLEPAVAAPPHGSAAAATAHAADLRNDRPQGENSTCGTAVSIAAVAGACRRPTLHSAFGLPGAADAAAAAITAASAVDGNNARGVATAAAIASATTSAQDAPPNSLRQQHQEHLASLLSAARAGSIAAAAAATAAAPPPTSTEAPALAAGEASRRRLSGSDADTGSGLAGVPLSTDFDGGDADGLRDSCQASSGLSVSVSGGVGAVQGGGKSVLLRALKAAARDRGRSRMLDEQFAALQMPDASGMLECPFATYAARGTATHPETPRRAPRESTSTAATTSPRASTIGYLATAPTAAQILTHLAAAGPDGIGVSPPGAAISPSILTGMLPASRSWEFPPLGSSPSGLAPAGGGDSGLLRISRSPQAEVGRFQDIDRGPGDMLLVPHVGVTTDLEAVHHAEQQQRQQQQLHLQDLSGVEQSLDALGVAPDADVGSSVAFAFAGHLGPMDSSPTNSASSPSQPAPGRRQEIEEAGIALEKLAIGPDLAIVLGPASKEYGLSSDNDAKISTTAAVAATGGDTSGARMGHIEEMEEEEGGGRANDVDWEEGSSSDSGGGADEDDEQLILMSSSAPARFQGFGLARARGRAARISAAAATASVRPEKPSGAQLETLEEEQDDHEHGTLDVGKKDEEKEEQALGQMTGGADGCYLRNAPSPLQLPEQPATGGASGLQAADIGRARSGPQTVAATTAGAGSPFSEQAAFPPSPPLGAATTCYRTDPGTWPVSSIRPGSSVPSGSLPLASLSPKAASTACDLSTAAHGGGDLPGELGDSEDGASRRLSDPGCGPVRRPLQTASLSRGSGSATAAARHQRILQSRMSPSFAIGVDMSVPETRRAAGGLTRHLSLSRAVGAAAGASPTGSTPPTAPGSPWRIARQPSSRWFSVAATDAVHAQKRLHQHQQYQQQQLDPRGRARLEAPAAAIMLGGPIAATAAAVSRGARRDTPASAISAAISETAALVKGYGETSRSGINDAAAAHPLTRRWASLQELAGQQRALDALCLREGEHRLGGSGGPDAGPRANAGDSGSSSGTGTSGDVRVGSHKAEVEELKVEYRIRLLAGFKRFFHEQALEGVLSPGGMRLLCHCCDEALHHPSAPLDLWSAVEREVVGRGLVQWQAWAHLALRRGMQRALRWDSLLYLPAKWLLLRPMRVMAEMLSSSLSRVMLVAMEVAVELAAALSDSSPQLQWLRYAGPAGHEIWDEVDRQGEAVRRFILDRVIEAPDRFQATQSHRAALALLRQQAAFVRSMLKTGLVDGDEAEALLEPIERRTWRLEARGPRWQQPTLSQVLASCALLRGLPSEVLDWLRAEGDLWSLPRGADLTPLLANGGVFIVAMGTVRVSLLSAPSVPEPGHTVSVTHPPTPPLAPAQNVSTGNTHCQSHANGMRHPGQAAELPTPAPGCASNQNPSPGTGTSSAPQFYVGVGGVVGMSTALVGRSVPGMAVAGAMAEGNTLGKGPVVFVLPPAAVATVRARAAAGWAPFQALLLNMYRLVGGHVLERQRTPLVAHIAVLLIDAVAHAARTGGRARAARLRELLVGAPQSETTDRTKAPTTVATTSLRRKQKAVLDEVYDAPAAGLRTSMAPCGAAAAAAATRRLRARRSSGVSDDGAASTDGSTRSGYDEDREEDEQSEEDEEDDEGTEAGGEESSDGISMGEGGEGRSGGIADGTADKVAAALAEDELLSRRCLERAADIVEGVRQGIKAASLVLLQPGQPLLQKSTLVLLNGTMLQHPTVNNPTPQTQSQLQRQSQLQPHSTALVRLGAAGDAASAALTAESTAGGMRAGSGATAPAGPATSAGGGESGRSPPWAQSLRMRQPSVSANREVGEEARGPHVPSPTPAPMPVFKPPTILLWLPDHCEAAVARMFRQSDHMKYSAGPTGAAVLVCGVEGEAGVIYR